MTRFTREFVKLEDASKKSRTEENWRKKNFSIVELNSTFSHRWSSEYGAIISKLLMNHVSFLEYSSGSEWSQFHEAAHSGSKYIPFYVRCQELRQIRHLCLRIQDENDPKEYARHEDGRTVLVLGFYIWELYDWKS